METMIASEGLITKIIGPVIDVEFPDGDLPKIYTALNIYNDNGDKIVAEVEQMLGSNKVRTVAMSSTDGLRRGMKVINTNECMLAHIIEWNTKYIIVADYNNKSFKIIDMENDSIYNINPEHKEKMVSVKKINHPIYGESLLSAANDKTIKLWTIE